MRYDGTLAMLGTITAAILVSAAVSVAETPPRDAKPVPDMQVLPQPYDHSHQTSVWISHKDVGGIDFWRDGGPLAGQIVHQTCREGLQYQDGPAAASLLSLNHWNDPGGKTLMVERRRTTVVPDEGGSWWMTIDLQFEAPPGGQVILGKTPFGPIGVGMAKAIGVTDGGGRIRNSAGQRNEAEAFRKPARWVDYSGPITNELPDPSGSGIDPITVDQLATHTSGFDDTKYHARARGEAMLEQMLHASPQWEPGSRYFYSCLKMILLGRIVEKASGQRLDAFCQSRIFGPLGMRDTAFGPLRPGPRVVPSGAAEIGQIEDEQARFAGRPVGNAGLFSTASDLARFCEMMLGEGRLGDVRILSPESHRRMTRNQLGPPLPPRGFGWEMDPQSLHRPRRLSEKAYGHSGHTGQSIWIDPEKQVYVIVLTNRNHSQIVGGQRKTQQYQARARIGDAALEYLESEGHFHKEL